MAVGVNAPIKLASFAASPIHYRGALFRRLAADPRVSLTVIFGSTAGVRPHDPGYGQAVVWDPDPLAGFNSVFLDKADTNPLATSFLALRDMSIIRLLRELAPDVVMIHGYNSASHLVAMAYARVARKPLLIREEQTLLDWRPAWKRAIKAASLPRLLKHSAGLYIGSENRKWFEHFGVPRRSLYFTPYAVDNQWLLESCGGATREEAARKLGLSRPDYPVIATVCRLIDKKQPLALLAAFRRVRNEMPCALAVAGSGPLEGAMRAEIEAQAIPDVHLLGYVKQSDIGLVYTLADVFALFSAYNETWGLVVNEAMNFGCALVVSDKVGCAADLVEEGENGYVVNHGDVDMLAARLRRLVRSQEERSSFGMRSRAKINGWTVGAAADGVVTAAADALDREHRSRGAAITATLT